MEHNVVMDFLSYLSAPMLIAASVVLYFKTRSPSLLVAAVLETISLLFRAALYFNAQLFVGTPGFMAAWQLVGLLVAACFLGFAVTWRADAD